MRKLQFADDRHDSDTVNQRLAYGSFVSLRHRLLFVDAPKAGSTTMKWILAALEGKEITPCVAGDETDLAMCIHHKECRPLPALTDLDAKTAREVLESPDYRRVCVVRNPYARLVSAWADKIRQVEPGFEPTCRAILEHARRNDTDGVPTFKEFATWVVETNDPDNCDGHWQPLVKLLYPDLIDYNFIIRTESFRQDLARLFASMDVPDNFDWAAELDAWTRNVAIPVRWSETYDEALAARVADFYSSAFTRFGYDRESWRDLIARPDPDPAFVETAALMAIRSRNAVIERAARTRSKSFGLTWPLRRKR